MTEDALARLVIEHAIERRISLATVESCTGGLVGGALTGVPGASDVYSGGFVTYSNQAKTALVGVSASSLEAYGAVSPQVAEEMAVGAREKLHCDIAISVTGIAGPGGGTPEKPVGTVWFGVATPLRMESYLKEFGDLGRSKIRKESVRFALELFKNALGA